MQRRRHWIYTWKYSERDICWLIEELHWVSYLFWELSIHTGHDKFSPPSKQRRWSLSLTQYINLDMANGWMYHFMVWQSDKTHLSITFLITHPDIFWPVFTDVSHKRIPEWNGSLEVTENSSQLNLVVPFTFLDPYTGASLSPWLWFLQLYCFSSLSLTPLHCQFRWLYKKALGNNNLLFVKNQTAEKKLLASWWIHGAFGG